MMKLLTGVYSSVMVAGLCQNKRSYNIILSLTLVHPSPTFSYGRITIYYAYTYWLWDLFRL